MDINSISRMNQTPVVQVETKPQVDVQLNRSAVTAVKELNKVEYFGGERQLAFSLDSITRRPVIRILDKTTGELVGQVPAEEILRLAASITEAQANQKP